MAKKKHIVILATGGTIAGVGEPGKNTGYVSGQISAEDLVKSVPELSELCSASCSNNGASESISAT